MTLDDARVLAVLLSDVPGDWPTPAQALCTCLSCTWDYQERLTHAFPAFVWTVVADEDETGFGRLLVEERSPDG